MPLFLVCWRLIRHLRKRTGSGNNSPLSMVSSIRSQAYPWAKLLPLLCSVRIYYVRTSILAVRRETYRKKLTVNPHFDGNLELFMVNF